MAELPPPPPGAGVPSPPGAVPRAFPQPATTPAAPAAARPPSWGTGVLCGLGAAVVGGLAWYLVVVGSKRQIAVGALLVGAFIGFAVARGARRGGPIAALIAAVIAAVAAVVSYFYIDRYFLVRAFQSAQGTASIDLLPDWSTFTEVLRLGFDAEGSQYLFSLLAVVGAAFTARRAS